MTIRQDEVDVDVDDTEIYRSGAQVRMRCRRCGLSKPTASPITLRALIDLVGDHECGGQTRKATS